MRHLNVTFSDISSNILKHFERLGQNIFKYVKCNIIWVSNVTLCNMTLQHYVTLLDGSCLEKKEVFIQSQRRVKSMKRPWAALPVRLSEHACGHFCIIISSPNKLFAYIQCKKQRNVTKRPRAFLYLQVRGMVGASKPFCM